MIRFLCFVVAFLTALFLPWWSFVMIALFYSMLYSPYELLLIGLIVDTSFGEVERGLWYSYTIVGIIALVFSRMIRPLIRIGT